MLEFLVDNMVTACIYYSYTLYITVHYTGIIYIYILLVCCAMIE